MNMTWPGIIEYLKSKLQLNDTATQCEKLITEGVNACFKIGIDSNLRQSVANPNTWPTGVIISRYIFRRQAFRKSMGQQV